MNVFYHCAKFLFIALLLTLICSVPARRDRGERRGRRPHPLNSGRSNPPRGYGRRASPQTFEREVQQRRADPHGSHQQHVGFEAYYNGKWHSKRPGRGNPWRNHGEATENRRRYIVDLSGLFGGQWNSGGDDSQVVNKPKPLVHPYSGELIRLRGSGTYMNTGLVQVYRAGQWGYVCDDSWDLQDASVACKQLGFTRGAVSVNIENGTLPLSEWSDAEIVMDETQCSGSETSLQQCRYSTHHDCTLSEVAAVMCYANEGCPEGWVSGHGKCYKFYSKAANIKLAASVCAESKASLVTIESPEENHFLSSLMKNSVSDIHQWYTGGKKSKREWKWYKLIERKLNKRKAKQGKRKFKSPFRTVRSPVDHDRWFPGWPSNDNVYAEPVDERKHDCITLSDEYDDPHNGTTVVDYYYWKADKCRQRGGIHFICQLELELNDQPKVVDCYTGNGATYEGFAHVTEKGTPCVSWAQSLYVNERSHPGKGLGDHNYCRNPDDDSRPWCWVNHVERKFGFCKVSHCSEVATSTAAPVTTTAPPDLNCPDKEFYCSRQRICIPESFRCDNELDCTYGEDEEGCVYTVQEAYNRTEDTVLSLRNRDEYATVSYIEVTDETCAKKCSESTDFVCRSFIYDSQKRSCQLSTYNSKLHGYLVPSAVYDYYEVKTQRDCKDKFQCANTFCVDKSMVCDGKDDCKDLSDELGCRNATQNTEVKVRLVGGDEHSGTVEVTYLGNTGVICDDEWGIEDATVVCKMLGYRAAKQATVMNYFDYPPDESKFILDDVKCVGNEMSIEHCKKGPWKNHDCKAYEIAGVECQIAKVCEAQQFKCKNELCVNAAEVCDGKDDCRDNSDEFDCLSAKFSLVNGSRPWEGRVEVVRNGLRGTVCDDQWDELDAAVVCRKLGFRYGGEAVSGGEFGQGQGPVWLDNVQCVGTETSLEDCVHRGWGMNDCDHSEDAGVRCHLIPPRTTTTTTEKTTPTTTTTTRRSTGRPATTTTTESSPIGINLVGGRTENEGNVEVVINNVKYRICDDYWDNKDATVICTMLGYEGGIATERSFFGSDGNYIIFDNVECDGTETNIGGCSAIVGTSKHDCGIDEFAGVICNRDLSPTQGPGGVVSRPPPNVLGKCGYRPYDYIDLLTQYRRRRRRRSPISDGSHSSSAEDDLHAPRTLGRNQVQKIVGGQYAVHGEYPWQVRIQKVFSIYDGTLYGSHSCGATIISEYWLLSAAHCFYGKRKTEFRMIVGDHHQRRIDKGEQQFEVEELILHERYHDDSKDYDIALIKIKPEDGHGIKFNDYVQPACLPDANTPMVEGTKCMISGWGNANPAINEYPETLKGADVPLIGQSKCEYLYDSRRRNSYTDRMMCAGYIAGGIDTCDGDSGGPLVCNIRGIYTLVGVTSWGRGCAQPNAPGVYARVTAFLPWIDSKIATHSESLAEKTFPRKPSSK